MKDLREDIIEALESKKTDDEIDIELSVLIREKLEDKQFWKYVASWKDADELCDEMEEWNYDVKREEIKRIKKMFKIE